MLLFKNKKYVLLSNIPFEILLDTHNYQEYEFDKFVKKKKKRKKKFWEVDIKLRKFFFFVTRPISGDIWIW